MKGIDAIISVILLLMISVALVATSYAWFSGLFGTVTAGGTNVTTKGVSGIQTTFDIENVAIANKATCGSACTISISVRNTGTVPLDLSATPLSVYINSSSVTAPALWTTPAGAVLPAGQVGTLSIGSRTNADCTATTIKLSVGVGTPDTATISCS